MWNDILIIVVVIIIVSLAGYAVDRLPGQLAQFKWVLYLLIAVAACYYLAQRFLGV